MTMRYVAALAAVILCWGCSSTGAKRPAEVRLPANNGVRVETTKGTFTMELYVTDSPRATTVFLQSVGNPALYAGRKFLRSYEKGRYYTLTLVDVKESDLVYDDLVRGVPFRRGTAGMMLDKMQDDGSLVNSATGFFICTRMAPGVDLLVGRYTPLGQVIEGMDVVDGLGEGDSILSITPARVPRRYDGRPLPELAEPTEREK